jgi:hypothetical protein
MAILPAHCAGLASLVGTATRQRQNCRFVLLFAFTALLLGQASAQWVPGAWQERVDARLRERQTAVQARVTATVLSEFVRLNLGRFPVNVASFADALPSAALLKNSFSAASTEPVDGTAAVWGSIGYSAVDVDADGISDGAYVSAFGTTEILFYVRLGSVSFAPATLSPLPSYPTD